jgi:murein DD-endopeptidase MepM/ murein hydrolase activator NlpD
MTRAALVLASLVFIATFALTHPLSTRADAVSELQAKIDARNAQVKQLEVDIAAYQKELDALGTKKNTLKSTLTGLSITAKQLASQIKVTQNKIETANLEIDQLTDTIGDKEVTIAANQAAMAKALRSIAETEEMPLIAKLISADSLTGAWQVADRAVEFNRALADDIAELRSIKTELASSRTAVSQTKDKLVTLTTDLSTEKRSVDANASTQKQLIAQTSSQETAYQKLIAQKKAAEKAFEQELINLQSQLNLIVNPSSLPKVGSGVLSWPFSLAFMTGCGSRSGTFGNKFCITQYFGNTSFSTANPQIYHGSGHNAIDLAAPIGTPIQAALSGTVLATGNTDLVRGCYSFGKWIMLQHGNGLSTLYAHLSSVDVSKGQSVATGQVIGLSGMTGYATGPHIHFGVYATEGVKIMTLRQFRGATIGCADATMPVATLTAYLNPLSYL